MTQQSDTTERVTIKYEVIGRSVVLDKSDLQRHALRLLYRGDGTPWWTCSAGLDLTVPSDFAAQPGEFVTLTVERQERQ